MRKDNGQREGRCQEIWEKNLAILQARAEWFDCLPPLPGTPHPFQQVKFLPGEYPSLQVMGEEGRSVTLHSPRRAWQEAQELAQTTPVGGARYLVALGLGLGYHLLSLLPSLGEDQYLIVVEKEVEVVWAALSALDLTELLSRPRTMLVVSPEADEVVRHLQMRLPPGKGNGLAFWGHPPSLRSHKTFYQEVVACLKPSRKSVIRPVVLKKDNLRVLVINPD